MVWGFNSIGLCRRTEHNHAIEEQTTEYYDPRKHEAVRNSNSLARQRPLHARPDIVLFGDGCLLEFLHDVALQ